MSLEKAPKFLSDFAERRSEKPATTNEVALEHKIEISEQVQEAESAAKRMDELNDTVVAQVGETLKTRAIRADIARGHRTYDELKAEMGSLAETDEAAGPFPDVSGSGRSEAGREIVDSCTQELIEEWENAPYTKEEAEKLFSEDHLASLSMEEYVLLLRRFPSEMVAHVTRQGIRDHAESMWHTAGQGAYSDGFMKIAADGRLRSPLAVNSLQREKKEVIKDMLGLDDLEHRHQAVKKLGNMTGDRSQGYQSSYGDAAAIHFATEQVADRAYGSETGNEIFIAYPSMHVASQYHFKGQVTKGGGGQWNDQWVWANEERGMDINAGLVFIPKDAKVDPRNGSRYELDEKNNPIVNRDFVGSCRTMTDAPSFQEFAQKIISVMGKNEVGREDIDSLRTRLQDEFGIVDKRLQDSVLDTRNIQTILESKKEEISAESDNKDADRAKTDKIIAESLNRHGILYHEAKNTINSEEFWNDYFSKNPKSQPSKIVYYQGGDPTTALREWQEQHGLRKRARSEDKQEHLGFSEHKLSPEGAVVALGDGLSRFRNMAEEIIEEHYRDKVPPKILKTFGGAEIINPEWIAWREVHGAKDEEKKKGPPPLPKTPPPIPKTALGGEQTEKETVPKGNFCGNCGASLGETASFCGNCGTKLA